MNKKLYALMAAPLLFAACNTPEAPAPTAQNETPVVESQEVVVEEKIAAPAADNGLVKYIDKPIIIEQGMLHINGFMGTLKPTLVSALKEDPTYVTAMGVCSAIAMDMTNSYNATTTDTKVRRTALKYRNPKNQPDATDVKVMEQLQGTVDFKPVAIDAGDHYRVYKPLQMEKPCLICHGDLDEMKPEVVKMIKTNYPKDMATGFIEGEFRGVTVAEIQK
ncbi:MAG: DUF3365 domain-containing protein [Campylobacterales bacterium]|nr:DUF3365 domain-containing protein [Campylobacterales bacterium]